MDHEQNGLGKQPSDAGKQQSATLSPKVTVLMPVYNGDRYLPEAVESVLSQTFKDFELLVVNDASTDGTLLQLQRYDDARIHIVTNQENIGLTRSLNKGLRLARGRYITRIDADDVALPERLAEQVTYLDRHPDVGLVASSTEVIDAQGGTSFVADYRMSPEQIYYTLTFHNCIFHCSVTFRRDLILAIDGYDELLERAQDYDLWVRVSRHAKIVKLDKTLAKWRDIETNISTSYKTEQGASARKIFMRNMQKLMQNSVSAEEMYQFHETPFPASIPPHITYHSLLLLEQLHTGLISECPEGLNKTALTRYCQATLQRCIGSIVLNLRLHDTIKVLLNRHYSGLLVRLIGRKLAPAKQLKLLSQLW